MLAGVLLVVVSLAGGLLLWRSATDTTPILIAARDIPPGHVIQRDDLTIGEARLDGSLASLAMTEADLDAAVGRTTSTTIHAGEMVVRPDLASGPVIGADEVAVTIPVAADTTYPGFAADGRGRLAGHHQPGQAREQDRRAARPRDRLRHRP